MAMAPHAAKPARALREDLAGKPAIVTGSTSGIGLGIARAFAAAGMPVMLNGFGDAVEIEATRAGLADEFDVTVLYSAADMTKPDQIAGMVEQAQVAFGWVEVLVNNAGILHIGPVETTSAAQWEAVLAVNLSSAFHAIRAALPGMKAVKAGRIINVASALGLVGAAGYSAYATSKHGTMGLTKSVALEVAEHGITVNAICPGYVLTPLVEREIASAAKAGGISFEAAAKAALATGQANGRFVTSEEIGSLAAYLASSAAASITGAAIPIDGGWTAR